MDKQLQLRVSQEVKEHLRILAAYAGVSMSEYVRRAVAEAWDERQRV